MLKDKLAAAENQIKGIDKIRIEQASNILDLESVLVKQTVHIERLEKDI